MTAQQESNVVEVLLPFWDNLEKAEQIMQKFGDVGGIQVLNSESGLLEVAYYDIRAARRAVNEIEKCRFGAPCGNRRFLLPGTHSLDPSIVPKISLSEMCVAERDRDYYTLVFYDVRDAREWESTMALENESFRSSVEPVVENNELLHNEWVEPMGATQAEWTASLAARQRSPAWQEPRGPPRGHGGHDAHGGQGATGIAEEDENSEADPYHTIPGTYCVLLQGIPYELLNEICVDAILQQAGLANDVLNRQVKGREVGLCVLTIMGQEGLCRCLNHFAGCRWGARATLISGSAMNQPVPMPSYSLAPAHENASRREEHGSDLKALGIDAASTLTEPRQRQARRESMSRAERIGREYQTLHPEVYRLEQPYLQDGFRELVAELKKPGASIIQGLKAKNLLKEVKPGIWTFPVFTEAFCDQLEAELCHFLDSGLPHTAPSTMNRSGIILSELGFCEHLLDPLVFDYVNLVASRLLPSFCDTLDSYRAFTVLYDSTANGDKDSALHYDNAEVTLNINIGGTWGGGNVVYYGLATDEEDGDQVEATLRRGWGVFHPGLELHKATPISDGRRHNLILWCRSSSVRKDMCPMCFNQPQVVPANRCFREGFTVPPCKPTMVDVQLHDMSSDKFYD